MGFDFGEWFENAGQKAQEALGDLQQVGVPALEVWAQNLGQDLLSQWNKDSQSRLNSAVKDIADRPSSPPGTLGNAFSSMVKGTILETYGMHILIAIILLVGIGFYMRGKK